jgi:hypothetical protein
MFHIKSGLFRKFDDASIRTADWIQIQGRREELPPGGSGEAAGNELEAVELPILDSRTITIPKNDGLTSDQNEFKKSLPLLYRFDTL